MDVNYYAENYSIYYTYFLLSDTNNKGGCEVFGAGGVVAAAAGRHPKIGCFGIQRTDPSAYEVWAYGLCLTECMHTPKVTRTTDYFDAIGMSVGMGTVGIVQRD